MTLRLGAGEVMTEGGLRLANAQMAAGLTVAGLGEMAFAPKLSIPAGTLVSGTRIRLEQFGVYTSVGLTPSIIPRVRLGGVSVLPARTIMGLGGDTNAPWQCVVDIMVLGATLVSSGRLLLDDNQIRIFGGPAVAAPDFAKPLDLISTAQWMQAGCSITAQGWIANINPPQA
jgi:hypothetical protein